MGTWALLLLVLLTATRWFLLVGKGTALAYVAVLVCLPTLAVLSALFELRGILQTAELGEATYRRMAADWSLNSTRGKCIQSFAFKSLGWQIRQVPYNSRS